ncbi:hypothetical protein SUGI_0538390 [Cryptomeria japonica]|nr:hypothetical protein SUGI_0538390 [Cryptomeria japonica]
MAEEEALDSYEGNGKRVKLNKFERKNVLVKASQHRESIHYLRHCKCYAPRKPDDLMVLFSVFLQLGVLSFYAMKKIQSKAQNNASCDGIGDPRNLSAFSVISQKRGSPVHLDKTRDSKHKKNGNGYAADKMARACHAFSMDAPHVMTDRTHRLPSSCANVGNGQSLSNQTEDRRRTEGGAVLCSHDMGGIHGEGMACAGHFVRCIAIALAMEPCKPHLIA